MAATNTKISWYGIDEEIVRWLVKVTLIIVLVVASGFGYLRWEQRHLQQRSAEVLERARGLAAVVEEEGGRANHSIAFAEATGALSEARKSWAEGSYRAARSRAGVSHGLMLSILDSIRNPGRAGDARFIYVEGEVELRRGETGPFRRARARDLLYEGDYVRSSSSGSAEILFGRDGVLFTVRPGTLLKVNRTLEAVGRPLRRSPS